jgi:hypothetical protein
MNLSQCEIDGPEVSLWVDPEVSLWVRFRPNPPHPRHVGYAPDNDQTAYVRMIEKCPS